MKNIKNSNLCIRLSDTDKHLLRQQADKLSLDITSYIRLIVTLDVSTNIIAALQSQNNLS
jgi:hypothetical protein